MPNSSKKPVVKAVYEIIGISKDGTEAHLCIKDTNVERFRVPLDKLTRAN
jgi:hypothetical protein